MIEKPSKKEREYWDRILHDHRLGMGRGRSSKIEYRGDGTDLKKVENYMVAKKTGRKGARKDPNGL